MTDYFSALGQAMSAEISRNPGSLARIRQAADSALGKHLNSGGGMAHDAMPSSIVRQVRRNVGARDAEVDLDPRGRNDVDLDTPIDAAECISAIQQMLATLSGPDRAALIGALHEIITNEPGPEADGTNPGALDRRPRSGSRGAEDRAFAARAAHTKSFLERHPYAEVNLWGRY